MQRDWCSTWGVRAQCGVECAQRGARGRAGAIARAGGVGRSESPWAASSVPDVSRPRSLLTALPLRCNLQNLPHGQRCRVQLRPATAQRAAWQCDSRGSRPQDPGELRAARGAVELRGVSAPLRRGLRSRGGRGCLPPPIELQQQSSQRQPSPTGAVKAGERHGPRAWPWGSAGSVTRIGCARHGGGLSHLMVQDCGSAHRSSSHVLPVMAEIYAAGSCCKALNAPLRWRRARKAERDVGPIARRH